MDGDLISEHIGSAIKLSKLFLHVLGNFLVLNIVFYAFLVF